MNICIIATCYYRVERHESARGEIMEECPAVLVVFGVSSPLFLIQYSKYLLETCVLGGKNT